MAERKAIPKKTRFEVFKRDSFTCQYCGRRAPDVILEIDHIHPVASGGDNHVLNLVTSCVECNRGKGARRLDDGSVLAKQIDQLEEINKRREQIEMMVNWKKELTKSLEIEFDSINDLINSETGFMFNESGRRDIKLWIKKYGFGVVYDATETSILQYYTGPESIRKVVDYIPRIAFNIDREARDPMARRHRLARLVADRIIRHYPYDELSEIIDKHCTNDEDFNQVVRLLNASRGWMHFAESVQKRFEEDE